MASSKSVVDEELAKLPAGLRKLAGDLGVQFPDTYGIACYVPAKIAREQELPADLERGQVAEYIQLTWNATYLRDRFVCAYCGLDGRSGAAEYALLSIDHLVPIWPSDGNVWKEMNGAEVFLRANGPDNLATACRHCNSAKSNGLLGQTLVMKRDEKIRRVQEALNPKRKPHRYESEVLQIKEFLERYSDVLGALKES
jgi:5-methylcytosine-specific restriction endonuclease McrA